MNSFQTSHSGSFGEIRSSWKREGKTVIYRVVIPENSTSTMKLSGKKVSQNGKVISVNSAKKLDQFITINLESGRYEFVVVL